MADSEDVIVIDSDSDDITVVSDGFKNINVPVLLRSPSKNTSTHVPNDVLELLKKHLGIIERRLKRKLAILKSQNSNKEVVSLENFIGGFQLVKLENLLFGWSSSTYKFYLDSLRNTLPDPRNLSSWKKSEDSKCLLCGFSPSGSIHILSACSVSLDEGRYSYRHDRVLEIIREAISLSLAKSNCRNSEYENKLLKKSNDWLIITDKMNDEYKFPVELFPTKLRPDILVYSKNIKRIILVELSVPFENYVYKQHIKKVDKYDHLVKGLKKNGYDVYFYAIEVSIRGIPTLLLKQFLLDLGLAEDCSNKYLNRISKKAIQASHYIWVHRKNKWNIDSGCFIPYTSNNDNNTGTENSTELEVNKNEPKVCLEGVQNA